MQHRHASYLFHIVDEADLLASVVSDLTFEDFVASRSTQRMVERSLEIVGEALRQLSDLNPDFVEPFAEQRLLIGLRNIIAHQYAVLELDIIWRTATLAIPRLRGEAEVVLKYLDERSID